MVEMMWAPRWLSTTEDLFDQVVGVVWVKRLHYVRIWHNDAHFFNGRALVSHLIRDVERVPASRSFGVVVDEERIEIVTACGHRVVIAGPSNRKALRGSLWDQPLDLGPSCSACRTGVPSFSPIPVLGWREIELLDRARVDVGSVEDER